VAHSLESAVLQTLHAPAGWHSEFQEKAPQALTVMGLHSAAVSALRLALLGRLLWRSAATIEKVSQRISDEVWYSFDGFVDVGLSPGAKIVIDLRNDQPANNTYIMMLTRAQVRQANQTNLPADHGLMEESVSSYLSSWWRKNFYDHVQTSFTINAPRDDCYHLGVFNAQAQPLKIHGSYSFVNPGGEQLPLQEVKVPIVLLWMTSLFSLSCAGLLALLGSKWRHGRTRMHLWMVLVLFLKTMVLFLRWLNIVLVSRTGTDTMPGRVGWRLLDKVQTIMELMMFLLIALGWKFLRTTLNVTEVRFAVGISVISFYLGVFEVACTTESTCSGYRLSRYILHSLCYLVVIVAMNFNLQMVHTQIMEQPASLEAGKLYMKHKSYRHFRWIFLVFIVAPTVELFLKVSMMPWDAEWAYVLVQQLRTWSVYMCVISAFRPEPPPLRVFELTVHDGGSEDDEGDID